MIPDAIALDLSSTTLGWCAAYGEALQFGEETFKGSLDERLGKFLFWLQPRLPEKTVILEQPFVDKKPAVAALYGVAGVARALAANAGCEVVLLSPSDVKKHWTGKAHATKEEMAQGALRVPLLAMAGEHAIDATAALSCWRRRDFKQPKKKAKRKTKSALDRYHDQIAREVRASSKKAKRKKVKR